MCWGLWVCLAKKAFNLCAENPPCIFWFARLLQPLQWSALDFSWWSGRGWLVSARGSQARASTGSGSSHALQGYLPRLCWVLTTSSWAGTLRGLWGSESGGMIQKKAVSTHWVCLGKSWVGTQRIIQDTAPAALQQQIRWESLGTSSLWLRGYCKVKTVVQEVIAGKRSCLS